MKAVPLQTFIRKIPNEQCLWEFFKEKCKYLIPPQSDWTSQFAKLVLTGQKRLLEEKNVIFFKDTPNSKKFTVQQLYQKIKENPKALSQISIYIPDYPKFLTNRFVILNLYKLFFKRIFFLNVVNTVIPHSVEKMINNWEPIKQNKDVEI